MQAVDAYIEDQIKFSEQLKILRKIFLKANLMETLKWGIPCYTYNDKNIAGIAGFNHHCTIWFYQGALLKDPLNVLINAQEGKTKALRHWRFNEDSVISEKEVLSYIKEAIQNEKLGLRIKPGKKPLIVPEQLQKALQKNNLMATFNALSLSHKRDFTEYISQAKQEMTKERRLVKIMPMIKAGIGLNDQYKKG